MKKKLLALAFIIAANLSAETVNYSFEDYQTSIDLYAVGFGSFSVPNGTVTATASDIADFQLTLYLINSSSNIAYAWATYNLNADLWQFNSTFDSNGNPQTLDLKTFMAVAGNIDSMVNVTYTAGEITGPQTQVGGATGLINLSVSGTGIDTPEPSYALSLGLAFTAMGLFLGSKRRKRMLQ